MFDMSWGEVMVIGAVALIVIGPKDLPKALRTVGNMVGKIRRMAGEFQGQFQEAMREAELDDVKRQITGMNEAVSSATATGFNPLQTIRDELKGAIEAKSEPPPPALPQVYDTPAPLPDFVVPALPAVEDPAPLVAAEVKPPEPAAAVAELPGPAPVEKAG